MVAYWLIWATLDATATLESEPNEKAFADWVTVATCVTGVKLRSRYDGRYGIVAPMVDDRLRSGWLSAAPVVQ